MSYIRKDAIHKVYKDLGGTDPMNSAATASDMIEKIGEMILSRDAALDAAMTEIANSAGGGNVIIEATYTPDEESPTT